MGTGSRMLCVEVYAATRCRVPVPISGQPLRAGPLALGERVGVRVPWHSARTFPPPVKQAFCTVHHQLAKDLLRLPAALAECPSLGSAQSFYHESVRLSIYLAENLAERSGQDDGSSPSPSGRGPG
jgi:hypothetical protein